MSFETWFEVNKVVNKDKPLYDQFKECWEASRTQNDNEKLKIAIDTLDKLKKMSKLIHDDADYLKDRISAFSLMIAEAKEEMM